MVDFSFVAKRETSVEEINETVVSSSEEGGLAGVLDVNHLPLVSIDFNHNSASSIFDSTLSKVSKGKLVKVCAWYDNEWGFSNRMLDVANYLSALK